MRTPRRAAARANPYLILAVGMLAVSSAAILVSLARAQGVPVLVIAALRMTIAAIVVVPMALLRCREEIRALGAREILLALASGVLLALHFAFWIGSLDYTSVMSSVVFVSTTPLFVGLASVLILRERLGIATVAGIVVAVIGSVVIGLGDCGQSGGQSLKGDLLALLGAVSVSGYLLIGRRLRKCMSLMLYVGITYATAAVALLSVLVMTSARLTGYSSAGYLWVALLAAGPQLLGHSAYNWALKYVSATLVTVALLAEPVGATLLAIAVLGQIPSIVSLMGGVCILTGIVLAARSEYAAKVRGIEL